MTTVTLPSASRCSLLLLQPLPRGAYADAYELASGERAGGAGGGTAGDTLTLNRGALLVSLTPLLSPPGPVTRVFGEFNVERPAPECGPSVVATRLQDDPGRTVRTVTTPVHARYPAPGHDTSRVDTVELRLPLCAVQCGGDGAPWEEATVEGERGARLTWRVRLWAATLSMMLTGASRARTTLGATRGRGDGGCGCGCHACSSVGRGGAALFSHVFQQTESTGKGCL